MLCGRWIEKNYVPRIRGDRLKEKQTRLCAERTRAAAVANCGRRKTIV